MRALFEPPAELTITQTASEIVVADGDGVVRALHPDGEKHEDDRGTSVKTRWEKDRLVVETRRDDGRTFSETYTLTGDPRQLVVDVRFDTQFAGPVTVKRVYDAAPAE